MSLIRGLHHITAICGDPQTNVDFYAGILGLRLVKQTVNFDDPATHHLYFGDRSGTPGTVVTFFPWPSGSARGRAGNGQATAIGFAVSAGALWFWRQRLAAFGFEVEGPQRRFGTESVRFRDPDGIEIALAADTAERRSGHATGDVPAEYAIRGLHSVRISVEVSENSVQLLQETLGFELRGTEDSITRFATPGGAGFLDVECRPDAVGGKMGIGTVHHVAWSCADEDAQSRIRARLLEAGCNVTPPLDRRYFRSVYFREPGAVLFEVATAGPGFSIDESVERLGCSLMLPPWLEARRTVIEGALPRIDPPRTRSPEVQL